MSKDIAEPAADQVVRRTDRVEVEPEAVVDDDDTAVAVSGLVRRDQRGMVSAEWAVGIIAAIAIAGVLLAVITSGGVQKALLGFLLWVIEQFAGVVS